MDASRLQTDNPSALPAGTRLHEFELRHLLGVGGFGIVYLAFDHALEREVAIKEYMPASLAGRTETLHVSLRSKSDAETFAMGRRHFVQEAKMLAQFDHPSLLKVYRYWEANGTAYMAMPVMRGRTLRDVRTAMTGAPDEAWVRDLLDPLLGAIDRLHSQDVYHRDIAPDNILVETDGRPVLLDFGAARRVLSDKSQTLTAILKPAYAPIEQYAEAGSVRQGPWTDIYALGATLHYVLLGRPPAPATTRAIHDDVSQLTATALPGFSDNFLHIVDWMLAPRPADRPQNVAALREVLDGSSLPPRRRVLDTPPESHWDRTVILPAVTGATGQRTGADEVEATVVVPPTGPAPARTAAARPAATVVPSPVPQTRSPEPEAPPPWVPTTASAPPMAATPTLPPARSKALPIGLGLGAVAVIAAVVFFMRGAPAPAPTVAAVPASAPGASAAQAPNETRSDTPTAPVAVATAPAAPLRSESAIATVVVPGGGARPGVVAPAGNTNATPSPSSPSPLAAQSTGRAGSNNGAAPGRTPSNPTAATSGSGPSSTSARPPADNRAQGSRPAGTTAPTTVPAPVTTAALPAPTPTPEPVRQTRPADAPTQASPTVAAGTTAPAPAPAKPAAAGPEAACSGRNPLSYFVCMERTCLRTAQSGHPDCLKWRRNVKND